MNDHIKDYSAKLNVMQGQVQLQPGLAALAGGRVPVQQPLQDHATEIRGLNNQLVELRLMTQKMGEEFHSRLQSLEMKVGS